MNYDLFSKVGRECKRAGVSKAVKQITADFTGSYSSGSDKARNSLKLNHQFHY